MFLSGLCVLGRLVNSRADGRALRLTANELKLARTAELLRGANFGEPGSDGWGAH